MAETAYPGVVRGSVVLLDEGTALAEGTEVLMTPVNVPRGSPAAILAGMRKLPKVPPEWVDELERGIAEGRRPPSRPVVFPDDPLALDRETLKAAYGKDGSVAAIVRTESACYILRRRK